MPALAFAQSPWKGISSLFHILGKMATVKNWHDCLKGELHLYFETNLPSPVQYKKWLRKNKKHD